jgi:predicted MFS family arabinose efflux permease
MIGNEGESRPEQFSRRYRWYVVFLLMLVFSVYGADRVLFGVLVEPIKAEFGLSDATMGFVGGTLVAGCFALCIIPFGILADRVHRRNLLVVLVSIWSLMTALSGLGRNIIQLSTTQMLAAVHVSGGAPTMTSLISDLFPRTRRGLPSAIWFSGVSLGGFVGFSLGGYLAEAFGWRMAFIGLGIPGLLLAPLVWFTVRETPRGMADGIGSAQAQSPGLRETLKFFARQKPLRHAAYAMCMSALAVIGPVYWLTAFFQRTHGTSLSEAGVVLGVIFGVTGIVGGPAGGFFMDRVGLLDSRWHAWLAAVLMLVSTIPMVGVYTLPSAEGAFVASAVLQLLTTAVSGINIALINNLAPAQLRSLSLAFAYLLFYLVGYGFGSQLIGANSDWLAAHWGLGRDSLRVACLLMVVFYIWAAYHFWVTGRHIQEGYRTAAEWEQEPRLREAAAAKVPG